MAYFLKQELSERVDSLLAEGRGLREIERETGVHRQTIASRCRTFALRGKDPQKIKAGNASALKLARETEEIKRAEDSGVIGFCACGCGSRTTVLEYDDPKTGAKKGTARRWAHGHWAAFRRKLYGPGYRSQIDREKERDGLRKEIGEFIYNNRFCTRDEVYDKFRNRGFERCAIGVILKNAIEKDSYQCNPDELEMPKRKPAPPPLAPYERKFIPYERETELPLLAQSQKFISLDECPFENKTSRHETTSKFATGWMETGSQTPLDALMAKEDEEEKSREAYPLIIRPYYEEEPDCLKL